MLESDKEVVIHQNPKRKSSIISCLVSLISLLFAQFTLSLLPLFLPTSYFTILLLPLSALLLVIVVGLGRFCKKVAGVRASAPAFVFFSIFYLWAIYIFVLRKAISSFLDIVFNLQIIMIILGLCRIISSDPGFVTRRSSCDLILQSQSSEADAQEEELKVSTSVVHQESPAEETFTRHGRVRYCKLCKNYVMGFDHHCPAFGNCIGQRNHALFLVLLVGFAASEASYVVSAYEFIAKLQTSKEAGRGKAIACRNLVVGSTLFCLVQVVWQVVFIMWHVYCASFNIKTDEWVNWRKYPEFQIKVNPQAGEPETDVRFINPYSKGILRNLKEFFSCKQ